MAEDKTMLNLLGQLIGQGGKKMGEVVVDNTRRANQNLETIHNEAVIPLLQSLLQAGKELGQVGGGVVEGATGKAPKEILSPYLEGVQKSLTKAGEAHAEEGILKEGPEATLAKFNEMKQNETSQTSGIPSPLGQATGQGLPTAIPDPSGGQTQKPEQQDQVSVLRRMLGGFAEGFQSGAAPNLEEDRLRRQKLTQGGELGKLQMQHNFNVELENIKAGLKSGGVDALNPEAGIKFALINTGHTATKNVADILHNNPEALLAEKAPLFMKSQKGRQLATQMSVAFGNQLRAVSGATLSESEIANQIKTYKASLFDEPESIRQKLTLLNQFYTDTLNVIDPTGTHRQRASGGTSSLSNAIQEEKKRRAGGK